MLHRLLTSLELPLFKRELIESAQHKRTYVLRVALAAIVGLVCLVLMMEMRSRTGGILQQLGAGRQLLTPLTLVNLIAVYLVLPAMACSAIAAEREKQTLSLLLVTKLRPGIIILEKLLSRMMPMAGLLLITSPALGLAYMLGGVEVRDLVTILVILVTAAIQVSSAAILCSSVAKSVLSAFWGTYLVLGVLALGPPLLYEVGLLPAIRISNAFPTPVTPVLLSAHVFVLERISSRSPDITDTLIVCVMPLLTAAAMLVAGGFGLSRVGTGEGWSPAKWWRSVFRQTLDCVSSLRRRIQPATLREDVSLDECETEATQQLGLRPVEYAITVPAERAICWREVRSTAMARRLLPLGLMLGIWAGEYFLCALRFESDPVRLEYCNLFEAVSVIVLCLIVAGVACRMFAGERERQTLDSLLVTPLSNRDLLSQKSHAINRAILFAAILMFGCTMSHLFFVEFAQILTRFRNVAGPSVPIFGALYYESWYHVSQFVFGTVAFTVIYLSIVKWIGIYCGVKFGSQMKAMVATILCLLAICFVPMLCLLFIMLPLNLTPDDFFPFVVSSPLFVFGFNISHQLDQIVSRSLAGPGSAVIALLANTAVYGSLALILRSVVRRRFALLLNRVDDSPVA